MESCRQGEETEEEKAVYRPASTLPMSNKLDELLKLKSGGTYVPPAKLKALMAEIEVDRNSEEFQKLEWEQLKKDIKGLVNKISKENLKEIIVEMFKMNLFRGKGLLCQALLTAQQLSVSYSALYASLVSVLNSKIPSIGDLLIRRLIIKYKRFLRRENVDCEAVIIFLSELANFKVCSYDLLVEIGNQLMDTPTDFKVQLLLNMLSSSGLLLYDYEGKWFDFTLHFLRNILAENMVNAKTEFLVQKFLDDFKQQAKVGFELDDELDLVEEEDVVTHKMSLNDNVKGDEELDVFHFEDNYLETNDKYNELKRDILGSDAEDEDEQGDVEKDENSGDFSSDNEEEEVVEEEEEEEGVGMRGSKLTVQIKDLTEQELTNFQKNVYLTIMSSMGPEEATHKLLKLPSIDPKRKEYMLTDMVVKCCAQEKVYSKYYGLIGENLIIINKRWQSEFQLLFKENYENCHKFETSLLRNIGAFWGHMLASDKLGWECLSNIKLTENDTTSSGRIFIKFIFQKMLEEMGPNHLNERINEEFIQEYIGGIFPKDDAENIRFSINFFTAIGMGKLTDKMRETLDQLPSNLIEDEYDNISDSSRDESPVRSSSKPSSNLDDLDNRGRERTNQQRDQSPARRDTSFSRSRSNSPVSKTNEVTIPTGPRGFNSRGRGRGRGRGHGRGRGYDRNSDWSRNDYRHDARYDNRGFENREYNNRGYDDKQYNNRQYDYRSYHNQSYDVSRSDDKYTDKTFQSRRHDN